MLGEWYKVSVPLVWWSSTAHYTDINAIFCGLNGLVDLVGLQSNTSQYAEHTVTA